MIYKSIDIWEGYEYSSDTENKFRPTLTTYILNKNTFDGRITDKSRGAVLICPGGAYVYTSEREAEPIAMKFLAEGFNVFILDYSVTPIKYPQPLLDLARAMTIIRENAEQWLVDKNDITVCGFSAGGHLAASLGVFWNKTSLWEIDGIKKEFVQPNRLILAYPVITSKNEYKHGNSIENLMGVNATEAQLKEVSLEDQVGEHTPSTFLWHTCGDLDVSLENTLLFANALRKYKIPFEMHIYPEGGHGLALANEETTMKGNPLRPHVATWLPLVVQWLKKSL